MNERLPEIRRYFTVVSNKVDSNALHTAAMVGNVEIIELLISNGYGEFINSFDDWGFTPLMWAGRFENIKCMDFLLASGALINIYDDSRIGNTVLREIVDFAGLETIKFLLDHGADPSIRGWMRLNAIDVAKQRYEDEPNKENARILEMVQSGGTTER